MMPGMSLEIVRLSCPEGSNVILGQAHFIKTAEDVYEAVASSAPGARFGLAFAEASGPCLVRSEGTDPELRKVAEENMLRLGCGHVFLVVLGDTWPIQVLPAVRAVPEVCTIFCATSNQVGVVVARTADGGGVLGVMDGSPPTAVESDEDVSSRRELLRRFGYKR
ncbi:MAG: adenosine-specific kinase [Candidatus Fermentibacter sp.]|nr:adenosine-specific kinase [Candidatus Fermentibacter sp.]